MTMKKYEGFYLESEEKSTPATIENLKVTLGELAKGYHDNSDDVCGGVFGWDGKLTIRPEYQRAYVVDCKPEWQSKLVHSVINDRPINTIYFGDNGDGLYQNIDGQQRLMTLLSFINNELSLTMKGRSKKVIFHDLPIKLKVKILNYIPDIKLFKGDDDELLDMFLTLNQETSVLKRQEIRNGTYHGPFVEKLKRRFATTSSKNRETGDNGYVIRNDSKYFYGLYTNKLKPFQQDVVEVALDWMTYNKDDDKDTRIENYMEIYKNDENEAEKVFENWKNIIDWIHNLFLFGGKCPVNCMTKVNWGRLYNKYKDEIFSDTDCENITKRVYELLKHKDVRGHSNIFEFVLFEHFHKNDDDAIAAAAARLLQPRVLEKDDIETLYYYQDCRSIIDGNVYKLEELEAHHIIPVYKGGKTDFDNMVLITKEQHQDIHGGYYSINDIKNMKYEHEKKYAHTK